MSEIDLLARLFKVSEIAKHPIRVGILYFLWQMFLVVAFLAISEILAHYLTGILGYNLWWRRLISMWVVSVGVTISRKVITAFEVLWWPVFHDKKWEWSLLLIIFLSYLCLFASASAEQNPFGRPISFNFKNVTDFFSAKAHSLNLGAKYMAKFLKAESQVVYLQYSNRKLEKTVNTLESDFSVTRSELQRIKKYNSQLDQEIEDYKVTLSSLNSLRKERDNLQQVSQGLNAKVQSLQSELQQVKAESEILQNNNLQLENEGKDLKTKISTLNFLEQENSELDATVRSLRQDLDSVNQDRSNLQQENFRLGIEKMQLKKKNRFWGLLKIIAVGIFGLIIAHWIWG